MLVAEVPNTGKAVFWDSYRTAMLGHMGTSWSSTNMGWRSLGPETVKGLPMYIARCLWILKAQYE